MSFGAGISIIVGVPGAGKSLAAIEDIAYNPGRVVGNIRLTDKHPAYSRYEYLPSELILQVDEKGKSVKGFWDWPALQSDYTIYIDEADIYFDCEEHRFLRPYLARFLKQHRKRNIRLVFIVQDALNLWVRIRRLAQDVILCHKDSAGRSAWLPSVLHRFVRVRYASVQSRTPISTEFMLERHAKDLFEWYDTKQLI